MRCAVVWASADTRGRYGDGRGDNGGNGGQGGQSGTPHLACCRRPRSERRAPRRGAAAARLVASVGALRCAQADVRSRCSPRQRRATAAAVARRSASWPRRRPCRTHANCAAGVVSHWTPSRFIQAEDSVKAPRGQAPHFDGFAELFVCTRRESNDPLRADQGQTDR